MSLQSEVLSSDESGRIAQRSELVQLSRLRWGEAEPRCQGPLRAPCSSGLRSEAGLRLLYQLLSTDKRSLPTSPASFSSTEFIREGNQAPNLSWGCANAALAPAEVSQSLFPRCPPAHSLGPQSVVGQKCGMLAQAGKCAKGSSSRSSPPAPGRVTEPPRATS